MHHLLRRARRPLALLVVASATATAVAPLVAAQTKAAAAAAPVDSAHAALARELLVVMQTGPTMVKSMEAAFPEQRRASPEIPEAFWTEFQARANAEVGQFVERLVPLYARRFSTAELRELIAFYRTPVGARLAFESVALSTDVLQQAKLWGMELGAAVVQDLAKQGVTLE